MQGVDHGFAEADVGGRHGHGGGKALPDFLGKGRSGNHGEPARTAGALADHFMNQAAGFGLQALAGADDALRLAQQRLNFTRHIAQRVTGHRQQYVLGARDRLGQRGLDLQSDGKFAARQIILVLARLAHRKQGFAVAAPQDDPDATSGQMDRQRGAVGAGTDHRDAFEQGGIAHTVFPFQCARATPSAAAGVVSAPGSAAARLRCSR